LRHGYRIYKDGAFGKKLLKTTTTKKKLIRPANGIVSFSCFPLEAINAISENKMDPTKSMRKVIVGKPSAKA